MNHNKKDELWHKTKQGILNKEEPPSRDDAICFLQESPQFESLIRDYSNRAATDFPIHMFSQKEVYEFITLGKYPVIRKALDVSLLLAAASRESRSFDDLKQLCIANLLQSEEKHEVLLRVAAEILSSQRQRPARKPGPKPADYTTRDLLIVLCIDELRRLGIAPQRNDATSHQSSGCDILRLAMSNHGHAMSYSAIEKIWKNFRGKNPP